MSLSNKHDDWVRITDLAARVTAPRMRRFKVARDPVTGAIFIQVEGFVRDLTNPLDPGPWDWVGGRKGYVDTAQSDTDVFRMMLDLLIGFDEHETREAFLVDGERIFGPHITASALSLVAEMVDNPSM